MIYFIRIYAVHTFSCLWKHTQVNLLQSYMYSHVARSFKTSSLIATGLLAIARRRYHAKYQNFVKEQFADLETDLYDYPEKNIKIIWRDCSNYETNHPVLLLCSSDLK